MVIGYWICPKAWLLFDGLSEPKFVISLSLSLSRFHTPSHIFPQKEPKSTLTRPLLHWWHTAAVLPVATLVPGCTKKGPSGYHLLSETLAWTALSIHHKPNGCVGYSHPVSLALVCAGEGRSQETWVDHVSCSSVSAASLPLLSLSLALSALTLIECCNIQPFVQCQLI